MKCIIIEDDKMSREILELFISKHPKLQLVGHFENPLDAITFLKSNDIDLIFLDVEMPEMTGIEFINTLNDILPKVIVTTSHSEFAVEAFKYNVSGYLLKPIHFDQFSLAVKKAEKKETNTNELEFKDSVIFIKEAKTITKVDKSEIKLIECIGDYVNLFSKDKKFTIHSSMKAIEQRFPKEKYLRVHRSFIIRIDAIEDIEDDTITMGAKLIPIGKTYKSQIYKRLNIL